MAGGEGDGGVRGEGRQGSQWLDVGKALPQKFKSFRGRIRSLCHPVKAGATLDIPEVLSLDLSLSKLNFGTRFGTAVVDLVTFALL